MRNLNNKGFTLVEVIAAVVILAVLAMLLVPNVTSLLNRSENDAFNNLKKSILVAAEEYVNDNRYEIFLDEAQGPYECDIREVVKECKSVKSIGDVTLNESKILLSTLLSKGYLSASGTDDTGEYIIDPRDRTTKLDLNVRHVVVEFVVNDKNYNFELDNYFDD